MQLPSSTISKSAQETTRIAKEFAKNLNNKKNPVICLRGNLGTGKTTFVKGFCEYFNISPQTVKSPTYTYYRLYKADNRNIYHFDYYRLSKIDEIIEHELIEIIDKDNSIFLIEWPEKVEEFLPKGTYIINFEYGNGQNERIINFSKL